MAREPKPEVQECVPETETVEEQMSFSGLMDVADLFPGLGYPANFGVPIRGWSTPVVGTPTMETPSIPVQSSFAEETPNGYFFPESTPSVAEPMQIDVSVGGSPAPSERKVEGFDFEGTVDLISKITHPAAARGIVTRLQKLLISAQSAIDDLTVGIVKPISKLYSPWPMVRWREGAAREAIAIFKVGEDAKSPCSCLIHYGYERSIKSPWKRSTMAW